MNKKLQQNMSGLSMVMDRFGSLMRSEGRNELMTLQQIQCFLQIAKLGTCTATRLAEILSYSQPNINRSVAIISNKAPMDRKGEGYGLVTQSVDPYDRRIRLLTLTPKGEQLAQELSDVIRMI